MRVSAEEEERLRAAARLINDHLMLRREQYGVPERNALIMVALEAVADRLLAEQRLGLAGSDVHQHLEHLYELLLTVPTGPGASVLSSGSSFSPASDPSSSS